MLCPQCSELSNETKKTAHFEEFTITCIPSIAMGPNDFNVVPMPIHPPNKVIQLLTLMPMGSKPIISNRKPKTALKMHFNFKEMSS